MARIRSLKPEFWTDVRVARLPTLARLVYLCLISMADDEGRIEGDAETVWHFGFPRESVEDIARALRVLVECSRIVPYVGPEGVPILAIPTFSKHQRIDRPTPSKLPAPPKVAPDSTNARRGLVEGSSGDRMGLEGIGWEGIGSPRVVPAAGDLPVLRPTKADPEPKPKTPKPLPPIAVLWNRVAADSGLSRVTNCEGARSRTVKAALGEEPDLVVWERAFRAIASSKFHKGGNDRGWKAGFDFAISPEQRGKWLDEARNAPTGPQALPALTPEQEAADLERRREFTRAERKRLGLGA